MSESPRRPGLHQEDDRISGPWAYAVTGALVAIVAGALWWAVVLGRDAEPLNADRTPPRTEEVRDLESVGRVNVTLIGEDTTAGSRREMRRRALDGWGWVDPDSGLVQIPIERAMELVAARTSSRAPTGANGQPPEATPAAVDTAASPEPSAGTARPDTATGVGGGGP